MPDYAKIIEREFRNATGTMNPIHVEIADEQITVWCQLQSFVCDCSDDEQFVFICQERDTKIVFPIPEDYLQ